MCSPACAAFARAWSDHLVQLSWIPSSHARRRRVLQGLPVLPYNVPPRLCHAQLCLLASRVPRCRHTHKTRCQPTVGYPKAHSKLCQCWVPCHWQLRAGAKQPLLFWVLVQLSHPSTAAPLHCCWRCAPSAVVAAWLSLVYGCIYCAFQICKCCHGCLAGCAHCGFQLAGIAQV